MTMVAMCPVQDPIQRGEIRREKRGHGAGLVSVDGPRGLMLRLEVRGAEAGGLRARLQLTDSGTREGWAFPSTAPSAISFLFLLMAGR